MNIIELQNLASIIGKSNGYLSVNRENQLEIKGSSFLGRIVHWVQFKFNRDYQQATLVAKRKVMASLLGNDKYGEDFQQRINNVDPQSRFFYEHKPLSVRKVSLFINQVMEDSKARKIERATDWVNWLSGMVERDSSNEYFGRRCEDIVTEKVAAVRGLKIEHVDLSALHKEVAKTALSDQLAIATITTPQQAKAHVDSVLTAILNRRITDAHLKLQDKLVDKLEAAGLSEANEQTLGAEILDGKIATMSELATAVNKILIKQIGDEFDSLLQQAMQSQGFDGKLMQLSEVKMQLQLQLSRQNKHSMLSTGAARKQASQLLSEWVQNKQQALATLQTSLFSGEGTLLKKLVLQDPYLTKTQVECIQQSFERTMEEIYAQNREAYEACGINKGTFLSKLRQCNRRDVLFDKLNNQLKQATKPDALFDYSHWQVADIETTVRDYVKTTSEPIVEGYKQVLVLKGKIPKHIYQTLIEQINQGHMWSADFISVANELYIDTLTANDNQGFYRVLQSSQVAKKAIGSKADLKMFTLNELLEKMCDGKNIKDPQKRRQMIDAVIPERIRTTLLNELEKQLAMVKSRVMSETDAESLFHRAMVRFLRDQKISFESMQITAEPKSDSAPTIYETPL